ncbi:glycosyltransferase family 2 protein [Flavobacterium sp. GT2N3]|uniref:glycosyltransferase family 2 protein n=1 Tax=unclassified Flavobacterium TaxID=196869 RepID=UPI003AAC1275
MKLKLSVIVIAYNEERIIEKCLQKLYWADEIIVVDSGSTDNTVAICEKYNAKVIFNKFVDYGTQKHFAVQQTSYDWVLSLDADEVLLDELISEIIKQFKLNNTAIVGYYLKCRHVFLGKVFMYGNESNRNILRLFNKKFGNFDLKSVHESICVRGNTHKFKNAYLHYTTDSLQGYINKLNKYTQLYAENKFLRNKKYSLFEIIIKTKFEFIKKYFFEFNFMNGKEGFYWAYFSAFYTGVKCIKTNEKYHLSKK